MPDLSRISASLISPKKVINYIPSLILINLTTNLSHSHTKIKSIHINFDKNFSTNWRRSAMQGPWKSHGQRLHPQRLPFAGKHLKCIRRVRHLRLRDHIAGPQQPRPHVHARGSGAERLLPAALPPEGHGARGGAKGSLGNRIHNLQPNQQLLHQSCAERRRVCGARGARAHRA